MKSELFEALREGDASKLSNILKGDINVNCKNDEGYTPLSLACIKPDLAMVTVLIDNKVDVNIKVLRKGYTPLYCAACNGFVSSNETKTLG